MLEAVLIGGGVLSSSESLYNYKLSKNSCFTSHIKFHDTNVTQILSLISIFTESISNGK